MRAYSEDLRKRIVEAVMEGLSKAEVARQYKVNRSTVYAYLKRHEAGDLSAKPSPGRSYKLSPHQV